MIKKYTEASAPGRLDVMGGIADYSGSLVLQMPITQHTKIQLTLRDDYQCHIKSEISLGETLTAHVDYRNYLDNQQINYPFAQRKFKQDRSTSWISYILGCALVLQKEKGIDFKGADIDLHSDVPLGKGVSSSASVEVATLKALAEVFDVQLPGTLLPTLAQRVENLIVGAPCGLMDQLACFLGEPKKLLPILCQPDIIENPISLPDDVSFIGIDSGVRHSVAGASYSDVRCAAFMGYTIIAYTLGISQEQLHAAKTENNFSALPFRGFLCNLSVKQFEDSLLDHLPVSMSGKEFREKFAVSIDHVTAIDEEKDYHVRQCASHPVYEHERVQRFKEYLIALNQLTTPNGRSTILKNMGDLMYQSHESYSRCGLGSGRTDEIVSLAKNAAGVYGAKITGGGNGGTVCRSMKKGKNRHNRFTLHFAKSTRKILCSFNRNFSIMNSDNYDLNQIKL
jgi:galactokinase